MEIRRANVKAGEVSRKDAKTQRSRTNMVLPLRLCVFAGKFGQ
jgi:hypothetical protein